MITHGFGQGYYAIEWQAEELAKSRFVVLIFNYRGQASEATPGPEEGYDVIGQVFPPGDPPYNLSTAVAEHPSFASWEAHIAPTPQFYYSPPLAQDVTLLGAPAAHLYYQALGPPGVDSFQTHEAGNTATATVSGLNIDRTPPQSKATLPERQTFCSGSALPLEFSADPLSGLAWSEALFNGRAVVSG